MFGKTLFSLPVHPFNLHIFPGSICQYVCGWRWQWGREVSDSKVFSWTPIMVSSPLSVCLSVCLTSILSFVNPYVRRRPSIRLFCLSVCQFFCLYLSLCWSDCLVCLSIYPFVDYSVVPSIRRPFVCLFVCLLLFYLYICPNQYVSVQCPYSSPSEHDPAILVVCPPHCLFVPRMVS